MVACEESIFIVREVFDEIVTSLCESCSRDWLDRVFFQVVNVIDQFVVFSS